MENPYTALINEFVDECQPMVERLAAIFLDCEKHWKLEEAGDELLAATAADLHTLKGNSGMMGFLPLQTCAHLLEDLCRLATDKPQLRGQETAELLIEGGDYLQEMIAAVKAGSIESYEIADFEKRVRLFIKKKSNRRSGRERRDDTEWRSGEDRRQRPDRRAAKDAKEKVPRTDEALIGKVSDTIRLDFNRLDSLLEAVGEGVITQSVLIEMQRRLVERHGASADLAALERAISSQEKIFKRLQDSLMAARLLSISTIFSRFDRVVRDFCVEQPDKQVRLIKKGEETPIDKRIIDRLGEPLLHLIRNALAHGIETEKERLAAGKPAQATLLLTASLRSDRAMITVEDDGRGIALDRIKEKAAKLAYDLSAFKTDQDYLNLIFQPGFSTSDSVTTLAGRGVGMDIVADTIRALAGSIDVFSATGKGTRFVLTLPLTLTIIQSLVVRIDDNDFAIPLGQVVESIHLDPQAIHEVNQQGVLTWRNELVHVFDGGSLLGYERSTSSKRRFVMILASGLKKRGLLVDELVGHQEIVVKSVEGFSISSNVISGATILGNGKVIFILDIGRLIDATLHGRCQTGFIETGGNA